MLEFQNGSDAAFNALVLEFQGSVSRFLHRYLRDPVGAEDLTQEVFVRVFRARSRYRPTSAFRTWLFTIASRLALNEIRGQRRRRRLFAAATDRLDDGNHPLIGVADLRAPAPGANLEHRELCERLGEWIEALPKKQRLAVLLSRLEIFSYAEIAAVMGVSMLAVKSLLLRARETLRVHLERYCVGDPIATPEPRAK